MQPDSDDDAWRSIVENYGDRPDLGTNDPPISPERHSEDRDVDRDVDRDANRDTEGLEERFVPPAPPPLPQVAPDRMIAWTGLFGPPAVLLTALVLGLHLSSWIGYLLVAWFIGGFVYLVVQMPSGPRDPGDDGARL